ncbi:hypothetical protein HDE_11164 [Halotydeus destructor]|nr:hypothetical protein HDE_11164 [Halotydeus destructor]
MAGKCPTTFIFILIAALFCSSQLYDVLSEYIRYATVTRVSLRRPITTRPPSLVVCLTLVSFIPDYETKAITVKAMYEATPKTDGLIDSCSVREQHSYKVKGLETKECEQFFDVIKYIKQRYVCYSFDLKDNVLDFMVHHVTNSLYSPRFYRVKLTAKFSGAAYFFLHVSYHKLRDHGKSQSFTEQFRSLNQSGYGDHNYVTLTYKSFRSRKLSAPYDTKCRDYSQDPDFESSSDCFEQCVRFKMVEALDELPFSIAIYDEAELQLITRQQLKNETISKTLDSAEELCIAKCASASCLSTEYTPVIISSAGHDRPYLDLYITNEPETAVAYLAKHTLVDVTVYVLSSLGFWFGFSPFLSMLNIDRRIRSKYHRKQSQSQLTRKIFQTTTPDRLR